MIKKNSICIKRKILKKILKSHCNLELRVKELELQVKKLIPDSIKNRNSAAVEDSNLFQENTDFARNQMQEEDALLNELNIDVKYIGYMTICSSVLTSGRKVEILNQSSFAKKSALGGPTIDVNNLESYLLKLGTLVHRQAKYEYSSESISAASKEEFLKSLCLFFDNIRNESCMLFFTGHGLQDTSLVFETAVENYNVSYDDVISQWRNRNNKKNMHFFVLLDCCYSGSWVIQLFKRGDYRDVSIQASSTYSEKSNDLGTEFGSLFTVIITKENGLHTKNSQLNMEDSAIQKELKSQSPMSFCGRWGTSKKIFSKIGINSWNDLKPSLSKMRIVKPSTGNIVILKEITLQIAPKIEFFVIIIENNRLIIQGEAVINESTPLQKTTYISVINKEFPSKAIGTVSVWTKTDERETKGIFFRNHKSKIYQFEIDDLSLQKSNILIKKWISGNETNDSPNSELLFEALSLLTVIQKNNLLKNEEIEGDFDEIDFDSLTSEVDCPLEHLSLSGKIKQEAVQSLIDLIKNGRLSLKSLKLSNINSKILNLEIIRKVESISMLIDSSTNRNLLTMIMDFVPSFGYKSIAIEFSEIVEAHLVAWPSLFYNFAVCVGLKSLSLTNISRIYYKDLYSVVSESLSLESVSFINCDFELIQANALLKSIFQNGQITSITFINSNINTLIEPHPKTTYLNLSKNSLINTNVKPLFKVIFTSRYTIDLSFNLLNLNILPEVSIFLKDNKLCNELNLTGNSFSSSIIKIARLNILYKSTIATLNLSETRLSASDSLNLSNLLCKAKNLKHIIFRNCNLTGNQLLELTEFFKESHSVSITSLDISYNKINNEDLFNNLKRRTSFSKSIQNLYMIDCVDISSKTPIKAEGFFSSSNLKIIDFSGWKATYGFDVGNKVSKDLLSVTLKGFSFSLNCCLNLKCLNLELLSIDNQAAKQIMLPSSCKYLEFYEVEESLIKESILINQAQSIIIHDSNLSLSGLWLRSLKLKPVILDNIHNSSISEIYPLNLLIAEELDKSAIRHLTELMNSSSNILKSIIKPVYDRNKTKINKISSLVIEANEKEFLSTLSDVLLRVLEARQFFKTNEINCIRNGCDRNIPPHTKCLSLTGNCFNIGQLLKVNFDDLELLELNYVYLKAHFSVIEELIQNNKSIKILIITRSEVNVEEIFAICRILSILSTSIEELHLENTFIDAKEVKPLLSSLLQCPNLRTINLSENTISKALIFDFVIQHSTISNLILRNCNLTKQEVNLALGIVKRKHMETIDISGFRLDEIAVKSMINDLKWEKIDRSRDYILEISYSSVIINSHYNSFLQILNLDRVDFSFSSCMINSIVRSSDCIPMIIVNRCLDENSFLKYLFILTRSIKVNHLILSGNLMTLTNTKYLIEFIKNQLSLKNNLISIDISGTNLEDHCFEVLFDFIYSQINSEEVRLDISHNMLTEGSWKLINSLDLNKTRIFSNLQGAFLGELANSKFREDHFRFFNIYDTSKFNVYDIERYEKAWNTTISGHTKCVCTMTKLNDDMIVTCSDDLTIKIWQLSSSRCLNTLTGHTDQLFDLAKMNDDIIITGSYDKSIKVWQISTGECLNTLTGHTDKVLNVVKLTEDTFISSSCDKTIKVWNIISGQCLNTIFCSTPSRITLLSLNDNLIVSGTLNVEFWNPNNGQCLKSLSGHSRNINTLIKITDSIIASGSDDMTIRFWRINTGICELQFQDNTYVYILMKMNENIIISGCMDKTVKMWDISIRKCVKVFSVHSNYIWSLMKLTDNLFLSGSGDTTMKVNKIDVSLALPDYSFNQNQLFILEGHTEIVLCLVIIEKDLIASGSNDKTIKFWQISTKQCLKTLKSHSQAILSLIKGAENLLISSSYDDTIKFWEISSYRCLQTIEIKDSILSLMKISHDLLACGCSLKLYIFQLSTYECLFNIENKRVKCTLNIGDNLITGNQEMEIKIWQISSLKCLFILEEHKGSISSLIQIGKNKFASASIDQTVKIWKLSTGECLKTMAHNQTHFGFPLMLKLNNEMIICYGTQPGQLLDFNNGTSQRIPNINSCIQMKKMGEHLLTTSIDSNDIFIWQSYFPSEITDIVNFNEPELSRKDDSNQVDDESLEEDDEVEVNEEDFESN